MLAEAQMYQVVLAGDATYDGHFFFGVITTGIFCFPSCPSRKPRRENVRFFQSREEAEQAGLRPCKRCHSDLSGGKSTLDAKLMERAHQYIDLHLDTVTSEIVAKHLAVSPTYFTRLFRRLAGLPPHQYILRRRLELARQLLMQSDLPVLEIAFATGFKAVNTFYDAFRRTVGCTPTEYRSAVHLTVHSGL